MRLVALRRVWAMAGFLPDLYRRVVREFVRRQEQVQRRGSVANPARGIVDRAVAWAIPTAVWATGIAGLLTERDAAEMRANADYDEPFRLLDAGRILLRIAQVGEVHVLGSFDLLRGAVVDEDGFSAPGDGQTLADLHRGEIDFRGGERQGVACRVEAVDEWPNRRGDPDSTDGRRGQNQKIAPALAGMCSADIVLRQIGHPTLIISRPPVRRRYPGKLYC